MSPGIIESVVEAAALAWFEELGYAVLSGPDIAPGEPAAERASYGDVVLADRLRSALARIHPRISADQDRLRQEPVQVEDRERLRRRLQVATGGVVFTTVQKFLPDEKGGSFPRLSDRRNLVVIADEAHRSQYGFGATVAKNKDQTGAHIVDGFAKHRRDRGRRRAPSQDAGGDPPFPGPTDGMLDRALT